MKHIVAALIATLGILGSAIIISRFFLNVRMEKQIAVTGYAEREIQADVGKLVFSVETRNSSLENAYGDLRTQASDIVAAIGTNTGIAIEEQNPALAKEMKRDGKGNETNELDLYRLTQSFTIETSDVATLKRLADDLSGFIQKGYVVLVQSPQYFVSGLDHQKLALIEAATRDGFERAKTVAANSGGRVGRLVAAKQGVFQITEPNSTDVSSWGIYDTSTIRKIIKVTVNLEYEIE
jgi:hypothetical protein